MAFTATFTLKPKPPFSLDLTAQIFRSGDSVVRSYQNGVFQQVLKVDGELVLAKITSNSEVEKPLLTVTLESNSPITPHGKQQAQQTLTYIFNLNFDLQSFYQEVAGNHSMHQITAQLCGYKFPTTPTVFESLVDAIVEQQISIKVARTLEERLAKQFGAKLCLDGECYFAFPTPNDFAAVSITEIQAIGLSQRKAQYIHGASKLIAEGKLDIEAMKHQADTEQIIAKLDEIQGIGVWTAELTMLRGMQRWDVLPADDYGLRRVISNYYCGGKPIDAAKAREVAKVWGKWQGLAAFYLIMAEVHGIRL